MAIFDGPNLLITLDSPTAGVLNLIVEDDLYSNWKEWVIGRYEFNTETDVNGATEQISFINHSLYTGQEIQYFVDLGIENIGLVNNTSYFIRSIDKDIFELYDTKANAEAGPATIGRLDLTASGVGDGEVHRIRADNSKFLAAFRTIGGDPLAPGLDAGPYFFLQNQDGWRIISSDEDQTINYQGSLVGESSSIPIIIVTPGRSVLHLGLQPITQQTSSDKIEEVWKIHGLDISNPMIVSPTERTAGTDIEQTFTEDDPVPGSVTTRRT